MFIWIVGIAISANGQVCCPYTSGSGDGCGGDINCQPTCQCCCSSGTCAECVVPAVTPPPSTTTGPCSGNIQATYDCGSTCSAGSGTCQGIAELQCTSGECCSTSADLCPVYGDCATCQSSSYTLWCPATAQCFFSSAHCASECANTCISTSSCPSASSSPTPSATQLGLCSQSTGYPADCGFSCSLQSNNCNGVALQCYNGECCGAAMFDCPSPPTTTSLATQPASSVSNPTTMVSPTAASGSPPLGTYCAFAGSDASWDGYYFGIMVTSSTTLAVGVATTASGEIINVVTYTYEITGQSVVLSNPQEQQGNIAVPVSLSGAVSYSGSSFSATVTSSASSAQLTASMSNCGVMTNGVYSGSNSFGSASLTINSEHTFSLSAGDCRIEGTCTLFSTQVVYSTSSVVACNGLTITSISYTNNHVFQFAFQVSGQYYSAALSLPPPSSPSSPSSSTGVIVGVIVGVLVLAGVGGGLVYWFKVRAGQQPRKADDHYHQSLNTVQDNELR